MSFFFLFGLYFKLVLSFLSFSILITNGKSFLNAIKESNIKISNKKGIIHKYYSVILY